MSIAAQHIRDALKHLRDCDPVLKKIIKQVGPCTLRTQRNRFSTIANSIVSQQISIAAAATIFGRLEADLSPEKVTATAMTRHTAETLASLGISRQKANSLLDLTKKVNEKAINLSQFHRCEDQQVIDSLTTVNGIGKWSAQMFLIFALGRLDGLAAEDLGIRNAIQLHYQLEERPAAMEVVTIGKQWSPYSTIAAWYLWESWDRR